MSVVEWVEYLNLGGGWAETWQVRVAAAASWAIGNSIFFPLANSGPVHPSGSVAPPHGTNLLSTLLPHQSYHHLLYLTKAAMMNVWFSYGSAVLNLTALLQQYE